MVTGEPQPVYQEQVSFADLDLRTGRGQRTLMRRVLSASERVCGEARVPVSSPGAAWGRDAGMTCAELTLENARPQIMVAIHRAEAGQLQASALIIAGPANAPR